MIRPAVLSDFYAITGLAAVEAVKYSRLKIDRDKIYKAVKESISSARHFCWVEVDDNDDVTGALIGLTSDNLWAQRSNCFVALWKAENGSGRALLQAFKDWVQSRRVIRVAGFVPDSDHIDWRAYALAERMGFKRNGGAFLLYN